MERLENRMKNEAFTRALANPPPADMFTGKRFFTIYEGFV